ncbi:MAG: TIGR00725 family protein [Proteobacteria bacterium]|nr:TIGR00725 family protein [Pseudomonadota bacterium]MCP4916613.1 TIGR00725 family protein [Pseudomonadota bacterium]
MTTRRAQVAIIGGAAGTDEVLGVARELGRLLVDNGWRVVCGGRTGVMEAACRGAHDSASYTEGATVGILPNIDPSTANPWCDVVIPTGMNYARNALVVAAGDIVVAVAGSSGTLSEIALAWQQGRQVIALDVGEGWASRLAGESLDHRRADVVHRATTPAEVVELIHRLLPNGKSHQPDWG